MAQMTKEEFMKLSPEAKEKELGKLRLKADFKSLNPQDKAKINDLLRAQKDDPMTKTEAIARGAAQSLTFGFADEIASTLTAAGQKFLGKDEFRPALEKALKSHRDRDELAANKFKKEFFAAEVGGAALTTLIPFVGQARLGAAAVKSPTILAQIFGKGLGITRKQVGKGFVRGVSGIGKAAAGGGLTQVGKSEEKTLEDFKKGAAIAGGTQAVVNAVFPIGRKVTGLLVQKPGQVIRAVTPFSVNAELAAQGVQKTRDHLAKQGVKVSEKMRLGALGKALKMRGSLVVDSLFEALEKQGGAGLAAAHLGLLQNPDYQDFLDRVEAQTEKKGLTTPKKGKK